MKLLVQRLFFFAVLCVSLSSCFKAGPGVIDPDDPMFFPQGGTSFITRTRLPDAPNQPYELWDTIRVVRKGLQMDGKTNVSEYHHAASYSVNPFYVAFEPNGDISAKGRNILAVDYSSFDGWRTLPVSSHIPTVYSYDAPGNSRVVHEDIIYSYEGTESIKVRSRTFTVQKMKEMIRITTMYFNGKVDREEYSDFIYYAPEIGFFVKAEAPKVGLEPSPDLESTVLWELQEVVVK